MSADRTFTIVREGRLRARQIAHADALNRNGHADGTLLERGRAGRGEHGVADRVVREPQRPALEVAR